MTDNNFSSYECVVMEHCNHRLIKEQNMLREVCQKVTEIRYGKIALMCPHCFQLYFRDIQMDFKLEIEQHDDSIIYPMYEFPFQLNKCGCCGKTDVDMISLDPNIAISVSILNAKGYKTLSCCEGHRFSTYDQDSFVMIERTDLLDELTKKELPKFWKRANASFDDPFKRISLFSYDYENKIEALHYLEEWVKSLPFNYKASNKNVIKAILDKRREEI